MPNTFVLKYVFVGLILAAGWQIKAQDIFASARIELEQGPTGSLTRLDSCLKTGYKRDSALYYRALLQLKSGHYQMALNDISKLQHDFSGFENAEYVKALYYFHIQDFGRCADLLNVIIKRQPQHTKALYNRALLAGMLDDYNSAIEDLTLCISINGNNANYYYSRAYWLEMSGKYTAAIADYEQSIRLDEKLFDAFFGLANCYRLEKNHEMACKTIDRAEQAGSQIATDLRQNYCR